MNATLLTIGIAAVLALVTALVAPFFVDWNAHRAFFEAQLSNLSGREVVLAGTLDVQILPMPVIAARDVRIADAGGEASGERPQIAAPRLVARIALTPLLKGEVRVEEIRLDEPVLRLPLAAPDKVARAARMARESAEAAPADVPEGAAVPSRVRLLALEIRDGTLILGDETAAAGEAAHVLRNVNLTGSADSLNGPYRGEGGARVGDTLYTFRFGTGRARGDGALRTKLFVQPASGAYELAADGLLHPSPIAPTFNGAVRVGSLAQPAAASGGEGNGAPWHFSAGVSADPGAVEIEKLELSLGAEERAVKFAGAGTLALQPQPHMAARLEARQIDFDRALAGAPGKAAPVADLAGTLGLVEQVAASLPLPLELRLDAEAAVISGGLVEEVELTAAIDGGRISVSDFDAKLPGKARINGAFEIDSSGGERRFDGRIRLNAQRMAQLAQWLALPPLRFAGLELQTADSAISAEAQVISSAQMVRIEDLKAWLDDSLVSGRVTYLRGDRRGIDLELAVDSLDFDRYVKLQPARAREKGDEDNSGGSASPDIRLRIEAEALKLKGVEAKALQADLRYAQGALVVDSFSLGDLGGTAISASGRVDDLVGNADGEITAALKSEDLTGIAKLAGDLNFVSLDADWLRARARALSPAGLDLALKARRGGAGTRATVQLSGSAGGTAAEAGLVFRGKLAEATKGTIELSGTAVNRDGRRLARQIGLAGEEGGGAAGGPGSLEITLQGAPAEGAKLSARASLFAAEAKLEGTVRSGDGLSFAGTGSLQSKDLRTLILAAGLGEGAVAGGLPAALSGKMSRKPAGGWEFSDLSGHAGAREISGALAIAEENGRARFKGNFDTDSLDAVWLMERLFGADALAADGGDVPWPRGRFDLSLARSLNGELSIGAAELAIARGLNARNVRLDLALGGGGVALNTISGQLFGGRLNGSLQVHEQAAGATMRGRFALAGAGLEDVLGRGAGKPAANGRFDLSAQLAGEGRSGRAIAASLGGEGSFSASDGRIEDLDPGAFARLIHASDAGMELEQERVRAAFTGYLDAGALAYERIEGAFTVTDGILTAKNVAVQSSQAKVLVSTHYDIAENSVDSEWTLAPRPGGVGTGVEGVEDLSVPSVVLVYTGPLQAVERSIDISPLTGFLTVRRLEADVRRLEEAQQQARAREEEEEKALRELEKKKNDAAVGGAGKTQPEEATKKPDEGKPGEVSRLQQGASGPGTPAEKPEAVKETAPLGEKPGPPEAAPKNEGGNAAPGGQAPDTGPPVPTERPAQARDELTRTAPDGRTLDSIVEEALRASAPPGEEPASGDGQGQQDGQTGQPEQARNQPILVLPPPGSNIGRPESDITRSIPQIQGLPPEGQPEPPPENSIKLPFPDFMGTR